MPYWLSWAVIFEAHFGCHDIPTWSASPIKRSQRPDMTKAVHWDVKHQFKQTHIVVLKPFVLELF